ncbi:MAG: PilZ domain-containing protein [Armatimonadetes bacterium]|nr:PilZ domain-containing protein [Armatimonadota bacterium]
MLDKLIQGLKSLVVRRPAYSTEERRELIRLRCRIPVTVSTAVQTVKGTVIDMGLRGMRLKVDHPLPPDQDVQVGHPSPSSQYDVDQVRCRTVWYRKRRFSGDLMVGLLYADTPANMARSWVKYVLRAIGFDDEVIYQRRRFVRAEADIVVDLFDRVGNRLTDGTVANLGVGGALVLSEVSLPQGTNVRLEIGPYGNFPILSMIAKLVGVRKDRDDGRYFLSLRFISPEPEQVELLGKYVISLLKESAALYG